MNQTNRLQLFHIASSFFQRICASPKSWVTLCSMLYLYGGLLPCPTTKLANHHLWAVCDCLFSIFTAIFCIWRPSHPSIKWWHGTYWTRMGHNIFAFYFPLPFLLGKFSYKISVYWKGALWGLTYSQQSELRVVLWDVIQSEVLTSINHTIPVSHPRRP